MTKFKIDTIQCGYEGERYTYITAVSAVEVGPRVTVIKFPAKYHGKPVTHIGYKQTYVPEHEEWCDWHHPAQGSSYVPGEYKASMVPLYIPASVKKIIIPASVRDINYYAFDGVGEVEFEVSPRNPVYTVIDGKIRWKKDKIR